MCVGVSVCLSVLNSHSPSTSNIHSLALFHTHAHAHAHALTHALTLSRSHALTLTLSHSRSYTHSYTRSYTRTHTYTCALTLPHTHSHTLSSLKRKQNKLKDTLSALVQRYHETNTRDRKKNDELTEEYRRITKQYKDLQAKVCPHTS